MCEAPKIQTEKWHVVPQANGMSMMMPGGFGVDGMGGGIPDATFYRSGNKQISVGTGPGPSMLTSADAEMRQMGDCQATINGRNVEITTYTWIVEDDRMAPTGEAGSHFRAVARYLPAGSQREMFVLFQTRMQSDLMAYRSLFWTVTFNGVARSAAAPPPSQTVRSSLVSAGPMAVAAAPPAPACVPKADPTLPTASAVVDSATVQMLVSGSGPIPKGYALMALKFDGSSLAGINVAQSDLPDQAQKQLATLVASNLKAHDAKSPSSFVLRVETQEQGLRYTVQGACAP
ncbi:MAG: hypothetical protein M3Y30_06950 [Gemmatimonadota bacterium]|nr:hypothetical protein [Gemmatimonadota bacterium]